jgi:hypothetical protein
MIEEIDENLAEVVAGFPVGDTVGVVEAGHDDLTDINTVVPTFDSTFFWNLG